MRKFVSPKILHGHSFQKYPRLIHSCLTADGDLVLFEKALTLAAMSKHQGV